MPNPKVNPKDAASRFAFFFALNFTKPKLIDIKKSLKIGVQKVSFELSNRTGREFYWMLIYHLYR